MIAKIISGNSYDAIAAAKDMNVPFGMMMEDGQVRDVHITEAETYGDDGWSEVVECRHELTREYFKNLVAHLSWCNGAIENGHYFGKRYGEEISDATVIFEQNIDLEKYDSPFAAWFSAFVRPKPFMVVEVAKCSRNDAERLLELIGRRYGETPVVLNVLTTAGLVAVDDPRIYSFVRSLLEIDARVEQARSEDIPEECPLLCPKCGAKMRIRARKKDGMKFYGCVQYPECSGSRLAVRY